jgi:hypothetical protein
MTMSQVRKQRIDAVVECELQAEAAKALNEARRLRRRLRRLLATLEFQRGQARSNNRWLGYSCEGSSGGHGARATARSCGGGQA